MPSLIETLEERGFIDAITHNELREKLHSPKKVYCGFDPTSDSLHLGNLVGIIGLTWFKRFGHTPVALVGGATGMIGDPSGKSVERNLISAEDLQNNLKGISKVLTSLLGETEIVNNFDWFSKLSFIDFLRDIGKCFRMGPMLAKDSVKSRLNSEEGLSYTEFSYQILQAYDFLYLNKNKDVSVQIGGSDQWGNITQGTELVRKELGSEVYGLTFPLLTRSDGKKFGKSEKGAIWLSTDKLSEYEFYQYLYRVPDQDVIKLLKMLTFLEMSEIRKIEQELHIPNKAQKILAEEVTRFVHGEEGLKKALQATEGAFSGSIDVDVLETISKDIPHFEGSEGEILGQPVIDILVKSGLQPSKGSARKLIMGGGVYVNEGRLDDAAKIMAPSDVIGGKFILLRIGKKQKLLVKIKK